MLQTLLRNTGEGLWHMKLSVYSESVKISDLHPPGSCLTWKIHFALCPLSEIGLTLSFDSFLIV